MEAEQASLSTIVIDAYGNPIGQVIYRCALCRKICDTSSDAMSHYQLDHVEFSKIQIQQMQHQQQLQQQHASMPNAPNRNSNLQPRPASHLIQHPSHGSNRFTDASPSTSSTNSLLKRTPGPSNQSGSLLKRVATNPPAQSTSSSSLLRRAANAIRQACQQQQQQQQQLQSNSGASSNINKNVGTKRPTPSTMSAQNIETIRRQYTTTSASRAAKRSQTVASPSSISPSTRVLQQDDIKRSSTQPSASSNTSTTHNTSNNQSDAARSSLSSTGASSSSTQLSSTQPSTTSEGNSGTASTSSTPRTRAGTPRHVQKTNQLTANLKARINLVKNDQEDIKEEPVLDDAVTPPRPAAPASENSQVVPDIKTTPSSSQVSNESGGGGASELDSVESTQPDPATLMTPMSGDKSKSYSLRTRSQRKSTRIS